MNLLDHLTGAFLRTAARRWPAEMSGDLTREWWSTSAGCSPRWPATRR
jgi:hypothetical protein